jgi:hypothetical protein
MTLILREVEEAHRFCSTPAFCLLRIRMYFLLEDYIVYVVDCVVLCLLAVYIEYNSFEGQSTSAGFIIYHSLLYKISSLSNIL